MIQLNQERKETTNMERTYTNGEIYEIAIKLFKDYEVFKKSQEEAEKILAQHRLVIMTSFRHQTALKKIKEELKKRGISYPRQEEVEISIEDIIKRIEENKELEIIYIKEYKETWHGYIGKDNWDRNYIHAQKGYETRIREISLAYNNIIETLKNKQEQRLKREK